MPTRSAREQAALGLWLTALEGLPDIAARIVPDATDNPLDRLELRGDPPSGFTAAGLAIALAAGDLPIIVRGHEAGRGHFYLDPCNLHAGEAEVVKTKLRKLLSQPDRPTNALLDTSDSAAPALLWPDKRRSEVPVVICFCS